MQSPHVLPTHEHVAALERLGDEIAELSAHLDAATARLLDLIRAFDAGGGWSNGFRSCADWLSWRVGLDKGAARERVRVARALGTLPRLAHALATGAVSYSKVRTITRVATPETEERLLGFARAGTAVHVYHDDEGMVVIRGRLTPEAGAVVLRALEAARETSYQRHRAEATDPAQDLPTMEQQQADALALLAETALHRGLDPGAPGERYQVIVHVDRRSSRIRSRMASPSWRTACAFPQKRPSAPPSDVPPIRLRPYKLRTSATASTSTWKRRG